MPEIVAWDSCIIIDAICKDKDIYPHLDPVLRRAENGELLILVSTLSIAEVKYLRPFSSDLSQEDQNELIRAWFANEYVVARNADFNICNIASEIGQHASQYVQGKNLTTIDSVILATAVANEAGALITRDNGNNKQIGLLELDRKFGNPGLPIVRPDNMPGQVELTLSEGE